MAKTKTFQFRGRVAQLVEHHNGIVGVIGSIPFASTIKKTGFTRRVDAVFLFCSREWSEGTEGPSYIRAEIPANGLKSSAAGVIPKLLPRSSCTLGETL